ncbi:MAG: HEAT repeat domain-containing protein, partial [Gemmatimonadetes bacterium]|nr:HEAT repeat domain-containing protein [Gemmatimonadota bacterium]
HPAAALAGLGETGSADDVPLVEPYLSARSAATRRAAVGALAQLAPEAAVPHFLRALADGNPGVSKAARTALAPRAGRAGSAELWRLASEGGAEHVRRNALVLIAALGKWESIGWLLRACVLDDEVSGVAAGLVRRWTDRFNRSGAQPAGDQIDRAKRALEAAAPVLRKGLATELRFLMKGY